MTRRRFFKAFASVMIAVCLLALSGVLSAQGNSDNAFERVKEVQERHTEKLMAKKGVVGTAVGLNDQGQGAVLVLLENAGIGGIPNELEGVPVQLVVTGKIEALGKPSKPGGNSGPSPTSRWDRPVPIGVSTGNEGECSAGTISCRVKDTAGNVYALSNNHVYALENTAPLESIVLQPGRYDTGCSTDLANMIGTLYGFVRIDFFGGNNTVDCAIASTTIEDLGQGTPPNGYGMPKKTTVAAYVGMPVQKYGRTTGLTSGKVYALNATVTVTYSTGTAKFVGQILVTPGRFIRAGDSGSLMVSSPGRNPVGLLFAGSSLIAIANPIDPVLTELGVTIDGQ